MQFKLSFRNVSSSCIKYPIKVNKDGNPMGSDIEERLIWTMQIAGIIVEAHLNKSCTDWSICGQDVFSVHYDETSQVYKNIF